MKVLVFGDRLEIGGSQVNAIELSTRLATSHGYEVVYYATPGPLCTLVRDKGLRFEAAPHAFRHPSPARMSALRRIVDRESPDVVHAWDWWQCLDAFWSTYLGKGVPLLVSDMNMTVSRVLPTTVPLTFGTPELADIARRAGRRQVDVLVPPVDTTFNAPGVADGRAFRAQYGIQPSERLIVTVSRFAYNLKAESLRNTIDAIGILGEDARIRLALVGDGPIRGELEERAATVNRRLGRSAVVLTGALIDPRPAYGAADVFVGMGGSSLRALAFAKRAVVVGERGFAEPFTPETAPGFLYRGMYGLGHSSTMHSAADRIAAAIAVLLEHPEPDDLCRFGRQVVETQFSLDAGATALSRFLRNAIDQPVPRRDRAVDAVRTTTVLCLGFARQCSVWPPALPAPRLPQDPRSLEPDITSPKASPS